MWALLIVFLATPPSADGEPTATPVPRSKAMRLAVYIQARQPRAKSYAAELARRVVAEGKRHKIRPEVLLSIA